MSNIVNCLSQSPCTQPCYLNELNECRPICSKISSSSACNQSVGCYWNSSTCQTMDSNYCLTTMAQSSIKACRKDGNDYCYYAQERCQICNIDEPFANLISMDGRYCQSIQNYTCKPYFRQPKHAACRKYCEYNQYPDVNEYVCKQCDSEYVVFDNKCVTLSTCHNSAYGTFNWPITKTTVPEVIFKQYLGQDSQTTDTICILNQQSAKSGINMYDGRYVSQCPSDYAISEYHYCDENSGETGNIITTKLQTDSQNGYGLVQAQYQCVQCSYGYYLNSNNRCSLCQKGHTTYTLSATTCQQCPNDRSYVNEKGECVYECAQDETLNETTGRCIKCKAGQYKEYNQCYDCPKSFYYDSTQNKCVRCSNGKTTQNYAVTSEEDCNIECMEDQYINMQGECVYVCEKNTFLIQNSIYCSSCNDGYELVNNTCVKCKKSYYKSATQIQCVPCQKGTTTVDEGSTSYKDCSIQCGSEQFVSSQGECTDKCENGSYRDEELKRCIKCEEGTYVNISLNKCVTICEKGQYPNEDTQMCTVCPELSVSIDGMECKQCPLGMIANKERTHCEYCKFGEYIDPIEKKCSRCENETQIVNANYDGCVVSCENGYGPNILNACEQCYQGFVSNADTNYECQYCQKMYYSSEDRIQCLPCPARSYSWYAAKSCTKCSENQYVLPSMDGCTESLDCGIGYGPDENFVCQKCQPGYGSDGTQPCSKCTDGTYSDQEGMQCQICPVGTTNEDGTGCTTQCTKGYEYNAQLEGITDPPCQACSPGYTSLEGAPCYQCPAMTYADKNATEKCIECPFGSFSLKGSDQCEECMNNTPFINPDQTRCIAECPRNSYYSYGQVQCIWCPAGQYSTGNSRQCKNCPENTYSVSGGDCIECALGMYSQAGSAFCISCKQFGLFVSADGKGCIDMCTSGTKQNNEYNICEYCEDGYVSYTGDTYCRQCPMMTYAKSGDSYCQSCPKGSYSEAGSSQCTFCPDYAPYVNPSRNGCTDNCGNGYEPNNNTMLCEKCPYNMYSDGNTRCQLCDENMEPNQLSNGCDECGPGTYSPNNESFCRSCNVEPYIYLSYDKKECLKACNINQEPIKIGQNYQCYPCQGTMESKYGLECASVTDETQTTNIIIIVVPIVCSIVLIAMIIGLSIIINKYKQTRPKQYKKGKNHKIDENPYEWDDINDSLKIK